MNSLGISKENKNFKRKKNFKLKYNILEEKHIAQENISESQDWFGFNQHEEERERWLQ